jgi:hypothetical protein
VALLWQGRWCSCTSFSVNALADLCIPVQLTKQVAGRDDMTPQLKDIVTTAESIQTGTKGLQIT